MGIYVLLGIGLVFGGYSLDYIIAASLGIFTLKFMDFIFYFVRWLDNNMILFLGGAKMNFFELVNSVATSGGFSRIVLDYSITGLYFTLPTLFGVVMAWAGHRVEGVIGAAQEMGGRGSAMVQAGQQGGQMVTNLAQQAATGGLMKVGKALHITK
jgi:hypothetical protein